MPNYIFLIFIFTIAFMISYLLTPLMIKIALKNKILSKPGKRKIHTRPVPYLGGLAIYFAFIIAVIFAFYANQDFRTGFSYQLEGLIISSTLIMILGLWDDIRGIRPITKLLIQISAALLLFAYGLRVESLTNPLFGNTIRLSLFWSMLISVVWVVGLVNAMNLIDGLDGLATGITVIVSEALIVVTLVLGNYINAFLLLALAGSALGFLRFNFHPAKIFMGDTGSMFLGFTLASIALLGSQYKSATAVVLLVPITALTIPIYDTFLAVLRRAFKKKSIFRADKKHLHHRLLSTGLQHQEIVIFMYLVTLYLGIFAFLFVIIPEEYALVLLILLALGLFMGTRVIGFIEKNARLIHRLELKRRKYEL